MLVETLVGIRASDIYAMIYIHLVLNGDESMPACITKCALATQYYV